MHKYIVTGKYTEGKWFGRGHIAPKTDMLADFKLIVDAYSEKQALFLVRKKIGEHVKLPYIVDVVVR